MKCEYIKQKLTTDYMARIKTIPHDMQITDTEVPGFHLRYSANTKRAVFYLHYILRGGHIRKERNLKLGVYPEISAPAARALAIKHRGEILEGIDPFIERQQRVMQLAQENDKKIPLKDIMEKYLNEHSKVMKKHSTSQKEFQMARKYVIPMFGNIPINDLSIRHLEKMMEVVGENHKAVANQCVMFISYFLNWCEKQEYRTLNTNPVRLVRKFRLQGRDRVMSDDEYARFFDALNYGKQLNIMNPVGFDALEFIAFTGCRSSEAKQLTWDEVDFDNSILRLKDSKTGAKSIPIGKRALEILRDALRNKTGDTAPVFPRCKNKPFTELFRHWKFITDHAKLENIRIHDLRHSFATTGSMMEENLSVIGSVLGHSAIATTQRYTHINNVKGIEVSDKIAERIAKKANLRTSTKNWDKYGAKI
ncbi:MAG: tyrosine-type recombinase/integrase [Rickettsiales bacterium]|nr:tyrosine-type recombinase/integrase [Rickettsiales bacterium]